KAQKAEKPFFLWLGFKSTHVPRGGENLPERLRTLFDGEKSLPAASARNLPPYVSRPADAPVSPETPQRREPVDRPQFLDYMRHVAGVDENVGRVLAALDANGQSANTLVVFTSDNGFYLGEHGQGDKRTAYDESLRVPLLVRWPARLKPAVNDEMVLNIDLPSTFLDVAGGPADPEMQGRSLRPFL